MEPPQGTVYNHPIRPLNNARPPIAAAPPPPEIAVQLCHRGTPPTILAALQSDRPMDQAIDWAANALQGLTR